MIGWGVVEVITKTLYTQQLDWTYVSISQIAGSAAFSEMAGALLGGYVADKFGRRIVMVLGIGGYGLMAVVFALCSAMWHETWFTAGYLLLNPGILAMGQVGYLSMSMRISWTKAAATMFTVYLTVSNIGHVVGNWLVGPLREGLALSYEQTFYFVGLAMTLPLLMLLVVNPRQVDRAKQAAESH